MKNFILFIIFLTFPVFASAKTLIVSTPISVTSSTEITSGIHTQVESGGSFAISAGQTLTISGPLSATRSQIFSGTGSITYGTLQTGIREIYPEWYPSGVPNDSTDNTTAFQTIIDALGAAGNAVIDLNEGVYRITNLDLTGCQGGVWFRGKGWTTTYIRMMSTTGEVFDLTNARFVKFTDIAFTPSTSPRTAGDLFYLSTTGNHVFRNLRIGSPYNAFYIYKSGTNLIENVEGVDYSTHAWNSFLVIEGASANNRVYHSGLTTSNTATGPAFHLIQAADTSGHDWTELDSVYAQKSGSGLIPYGVKDEYGEYLNVIGSAFECGTASGIGIYLGTSNNAILSNNHVSVDLIGIQIAGGDNILINGGRAYTNKENGIKITGGAHINIDDVMVFDNSTEGDNLHDGIYVAADSSEFSITNSFVGSVQTAPAIKHRYGIYVADGTSDKYKINNNIVTDYSTGTIYDGGKIGAGLGFSKRTDNLTDTERLINLNATVNTTDATETTLWSKTLSDNTTYFIKATVAYQGTAGATRGGYERVAVVYREGGGATLQGSVATPVTIEDNAAYDCNIDVTANTVRVRVTGAAATAIDWYGSIEITPIMNATAYGVL